MKRESPVIADFIVVLSFITEHVLWRPDCHNIFGATRYHVVNSTTVSGGCQGEEDNRHHIRRYRQSHDCSAFYFLPPLPRSEYIATEPQSHRAAKKER